MPQFNQQTSDAVDIATLRQLRAQDKVQLDAEGRVIRSPETEAEIAGLYEKVKTLRGALHEIQRITLAGCLVWNKANDALQSTN